MRCDRLGGCDSRRRVAQRTTRQCCCKPQRKGQLGGGHELDRKSRDDCCPGWVVGRQREGEREREQRSLPDCGARRACRVPLSSAPESKSSQAEQAARLPGPPSRRPRPISARNGHVVRASFKRCSCFEPAFNHRPVVPSPKLMDRLRITKSCQSSTSTVHLCSHPLLHGICPDIGAKNTSARVAAPCRFQLTIL